MHLPSQSILSDGKSKRALRIWVSLGVAVIIALAFAARFWATNHGRTVTDEFAAESARANTSLLVSELQKFRVLPLVLTEYSDVGSVLERPDPDQIRRLNQTLELLANRTDAAAIYVLNDQGIAVAASNWNLPTSFIGHDYGYRPYFSGALKHGAAEFFALGAVSSEPGLFIARRITRGDHHLGVVVLKVDFSSLEAAWARQAGPTIVSDHNGVIIITSRPEWRFHTLTPLSPSSLAAIRESQQFGNLPLTPVSLRFEGLDTAQASDQDNVRYRVSANSVPLAGGTLRALEPLALAEASAQANARAAILGGIIIVALVLGLLIRSRERAKLQSDVRRELEEQVQLRTIELTEANRLLVLESREREHADLRYRAAREEVHQANRLASIGQITASVAHEINQPIAAIRTFAENAKIFLQRRTLVSIEENLGHIVDLTSRVGAITAELRSFAKRGKEVAGPVPLQPAVDGALMLVGDRLRSVGVALQIEGLDGVLMVHAERIRLEQVLINLLQNSVEAFEPGSEPEIRIAVTGGPIVTLEVHDNGPGIARELVDELFTPFVTGRPDGLGLGLGIARDIAREFGGELIDIPSTLGGAAFRLTLKGA